MTYNLTRIQQRQILDALETGVGVSDAIDMVCKLVPNDPLRAVQNYTPTALEVATFRNRVSAGVNQYAADYESKVPILACRNALIEFHGNQDKAFDKLSIVFGWRAAQQKLADSLCDGKGVVEAVRGVVDAKSDFTMSMQAPSTKDWPVMRETEPSPPIPSLSPRERAEQVAPMTSQRALYFMDRFKREEKLLGPNEQAAVDYVIALLSTAPTQAKP